MPPEDKTLPAIVRSDVSADVAVKAAAPPVDLDAPKTEISYPSQSKRGVTLPLPLLLAGAAVLFALGVLAARLL